MTRSLRLLLLPVLWLAASMPALAADDIKPRETKPGTEQRHDRREVRMEHRSDGVELRDHNRYPHREFCKTHRTACEDDLGHAELQVEREGRSGPPR